MPEVPNFIYDENDLIITDNNDDPILSTTGIEISTTTAELSVIGYVPNISRLDTSVRITQQYAEVAILNDILSEARVTSHYIEVMCLIGDVNLNPQNASLSITGYTPKISIAVNISIPSTLQVTGYVPIIPAIVKVPQIVTEIIYPDNSVGVKVPQVVTEIIYPDNSVGVKIPQIVGEVLYNPNAMTAVGDFEDNFSSYALGETPSTWSELFSSETLSFTSESNTSLLYPVGDQLLEITSTGEDYLVYDAATYIRHSSIVCAFSMAPSSTGMMILSRISNSLNGDCYFFRIKDSSIDIGKIINDVETVLTTAVFTQSNEECWIRFNTIGNELKARIWNKYSLEHQVWNLETTDSDLEVGKVGISVKNPDSAFIDYFGFTAQATDGTEIPITLFPPVGFTPIAISPTMVPISETASVMGSWAHVFNGPTERQSITGVRVYCAEHLDDVRVGIYTGGTATDPANALLLRDFGVTAGTAVDDWITFSCPPSLLPPNSFVWIVVKGDNPDGFYLARTPNVAHIGNVVEGVGAYTITAALGSDVNSSFPNIIPSELLLTGSNIYKLEVLYSDAEPKIHRPAIVFKIES